MSNHLLWWGWRCHEVTRLHVKRDKDHCSHELDMIGRGTQIFVLETSGYSLIFGLVPWLSMSKDWRMTMGLTCLSMFCVYINVCGLCTYENMRMCFYSRAYMWEKRDLYASKYEINMLVCVFMPKCMIISVWICMCLCLSVLQWHNVSLFKLLMGKRVFGEISLAYFLTCAPHIRTTWTSYMGSLNLYPPWGMLCMVVIWNKKSLSRRYACACMCVWNVNGPPTTWTKENESISNCCLWTLSSPLTRLVRMHEHN